MPILDVLLATPSDTPESEELRCEVRKCLSEAREQAASAFATVYRAMTLFPRFSNNSGIYDPLFPTYNAVTIPSTNFIFAEGPNQLSLDACARFFSNTLANVKCPVRLFMPVGRPEEGTGFYDYYSGKLSAQLEMPQAIDLLTHCLRLQDADLYQRVLTTFAPVQTHFQFYLFPQQRQARSRGNVTDAVGFAMHMPDWPDHGLTQLYDGDLLLMLLLARLQPRLLMHCSAGCGRSATLLLAMLGFQAGLHRLTDREHLLKEFAALVIQIRSCRPMALYNDEQCLLALRWMADLGRLFHAHEDVFSKVTVFPFASDAILTQLYMARLAASGLADSAQHLLSESAEYSGSYTTSSSSESPDSQSVEGAFPVSATDSATPPSALRKNNLFLPVLTSADKNPILRRFSEPDKRADQDETRGRQQLMASV